jgi:hypothetical protein
VLFDQLAAQRDVIAERVGADQHRVHLLLGVDATRVEPRPQHPQGELEDAVLARQADEPSPAVELLERPARVVRERGGRLAILVRERCRGRSERGLERLHVPVPGGARDQVQHLDVAGLLRVLALGERARERTGEGGKVGDDERHGFSRHGRILAGGTRARGPDGTPGAGGRRLAGRARAAGSAGASPEPRLTWQVQLAAVKTARRRLGELPTRARL